jgi:hypothetical protein
VSEKVRKFIQKEEEKKNIMSANNNSSALKKSNQVKPLSLSQDNFIFPRLSRVRKSQRPEDPQKLFKYIEDNVIGKGVLFLGSFGRRKGESFENAFSMSHIFTLFFCRTHSNCITAHFQRIHFVVRL